MRTQPLVTPMHSRQPSLVTVTKFSVSCGQPRFNCM